MSSTSARIGDLLELQRRPVDIKVDLSYVELGIRSFGRGVFRKPPVVGGELGAKRVFRIRPHDLLVSNVFAWEGAVAVVGPEHETSIGSHRFMSWIPTNDVDVSYVAHYLLSERGMDQLRQASPGSAGGNRTLSIKNFEAIEVPLPALSEQRRIAAHLGEVEAASESCTAASVSRLATISALADRSWGGEVTPVRELVAQVSRPVSVEDAKTYRMLGVRWYGHGLFIRESKLGRDLAATSVCEVHDSDLVYNRLFAWKRSFALAAAVGDAHASNEFPTFRVDETQVVPRYLLATLLTGRVTQQVDGASSGSTPTSRNRLKVPDFLDLSVEIPSMAIQRHVVSALRKADRIRELDATQRVRAHALLPAVRNEIFSAMR